ncbi:PREDICTED: uncharacterized protein LOC104717616 isoform X2 [Camelina sativa]|uniref:Uncharacterized protein LOC104717616 isoform X2 n=1 Tax=Camelina sativa TaxID=90675 RepID=A0ABM0TZ59_CAMSA|nr:PREDICTED: uncharacterized protein LOC104717616 isoform X2 [Camelina sativa]
MRGLYHFKRFSFFRSLLSFAIATSPGALTTSRSLYSLSRSLSSAPYAAGGCCRETPLLHSPWSALQRRGVKVNAIQLRAGNVIERTGRTFRVVEAEHKQQGRGGASIQVELRDVDSGNKLNLRFGSEESVEKVFVEEKSFTCLYTEGDTAYLIEPNTFEQVEVPLDIFGKAAVYLKEEMKVQLQLYDGRALSASIPKHITCTVVETQLPMKGLTSAPRYKRALLDNGSTIQSGSYKYQSNSRFHLEFHRYHLIWRQVKRL